MSPAHVLEPTYEALRHRLIVGAWPAGQRLEAGRLAVDLGVSITPVRDSLNRLTGERLIVSQPGDGFYVPRLDEAGLRALLGWHRSIVTLALDRERTKPDAKIAPVQGEFADRSAQLFGALVARANDEELDQAINNAAARLGRFRHHERRVFPNADSEIDELERMIDDENVTLLREGIEHYHVRRRSAVAQLIAASRGGQII